MTTPSLKTRSTKTSFWTKVAGSRPALFYLIVSAVAFLALDSLVHARNFIPASFRLMVFAVVLISLFFRSSFTVFFVLLATAICQFQGRRHPLHVIPLEPTLSPIDFAITGLLLVFISAYCRFLAIGREFLTDPPTPKPSWVRTFLMRKPNLLDELSPLARWPARSAPTIGVRELVAFFAVIPAWLMLGRLATHWLSAPVPEWGRTFVLPRDTFAIFSLLWVLAIATVVTRLLVGAAQRRSADPRLAELELNEMLFKELRPELNHLTKSAAKQSNREAGAKR